MVRQVCEMEALTEVHTKSIEPEFTYMEYLRPSRSRPTYWNNLGSSKSRSKVQEQQAKQVIDEILQNEDPNTVIAFTNGSCRGNPGPCVAGSWVFMPTGEKVELKQPVSKMAFILVGELVAVKTRLLPSNIVPYRFHHCQKFHHCQNIFLFVSIATRIFDVGTT
ncbi:hypothetical protein DPMN_106910 [Dreissena polymorpha]|uniref:Uncharacterized protein n=1 Tax=Dreissena polymorpha TaxID=45954 RepID=A0A9D4K5W3_DREPO|nr:hypothetical protein DPMN_106910 [Dreissena polymorpha]